MKAKPKILLILNTACLLFIYANTKAQPDSITISKSRKSAANFISVSYQDVYGKNLDSKRRNEFERSLSSFGDRKLAEEIVLRDMIFNYRAPAANSRSNDSIPLIPYLDSIPFIINSKLMSPFLMSLSVIACEGVFQKIGFYRAFAKYSKIQKESFPHMPGGIANDMPIYESEADEIKWMKTNGRNWILQYPNEVVSFMKYYNAFYQKWVSANAMHHYSNMHLNMLLENIDSAGLGFVNSKYILENWDTATVSATQPIIADSAFMHQYPEVFIRSSIRVCFTGNQPLKRNLFC